MKMCYVVSSECLAFVFAMNTNSEVVGSTTSEELSRENSGSSGNKMGFSEVVSRQREFFRAGEPAKIENRKKQLLILRKLITENSDTLCEAVHQDLRRVKKTFANALDQPMIVKDPLGVVLIISPWNYPVSMILLPLIAAIAAGNTVIIKPSEVSSNTAATFEKLVPKYFSPEMVAVVNGGVSETTELLKERFDHILYTGCPPVAKIIMAAAAKHLTPVTLELGGKCPVIVEDDADIEISARRIAWGKWMNCGQTCLAPDYVLVSAAVKPRLVDAMRRYIGEFYGTDVKASKDYSRIINQRHFDRISSLLDSTAGTVLFQGGANDRNDLFIPPIILDIFGPVLPVLTVKDLSEALDYINDGEKPLAAYIFTRNESKAKRLYTETSSGGVTINDVVMHITVDTLPFGGVGNSGMGRYRGKYGFDTFTHEKAVLKRGFFGEALQNARYPPITEAKLRTLARLTGTRRPFPSILSWITGIPVIVVSVVMGMFMQFFFSNKK
ncbi:aldehyde dehydrogenase family protein [Necator americanus]|uniref:Aldehyde dehydrogenase n=1 Tax=Necator americanus TaxID=51031 RepID=W2T0V4_NECAM|nr:aldehyde dehydrogenase family protein [Necator americanus]ETN75528.1 aldehyde dehydrogenase family protein [Necator americanus]